MTNLDNKIAFISGFALTSTWAMTLYEVAMALFLGLIGGVGGFVGKWLIYKTRWFKKDE